MSLVTHVPEGLVPFVRCGYARTPELPRCGQAVSLGCRVSGDAVPTLSWSVDGEARAALRGAGEGAGAGRCYAFELGAFERPCRVRYAFCLEGVPGREYVFDVCEQHPVGPPVGLFMRDGAVLAVLADDLALEFRADDGFVIRYLRAFEAVGQPVRRAALAQGAFSLEIEQSAVLWRLKRLSQPLAQAGAMAILRDSLGRIVGLSVAMAHEGAHVFGLGERFDAVDQMRARREILVVEKFTQQGEHSYLPVPWLFNEQGFGWFRGGGMPVTAALSRTIELSQPVDGDVLAEDHLILGAPKQQFAALMRRTGSPALPPDWAFGVWMSANGWDCDAEVDAQLAAIRQHDYPASVLVLEAWSDEQTFYTWNDRAHWRDPAATLAGIKRAGLHPVLWQIPVVKHHQAGAGAALAADQREAVQRGYVVRSGDGSPYRIPELWFQGSLLPDFTNPDARAWWFGKRKHLLQMGVEGFKTDGGEFLYDHSARLHDGTSGVAARNLYANAYVAAYHEFMRENGLPPLTFSRAGWSGAQRFPMHWAGDQLSSWSELSAQLTAGLSAGLSGIVFWGFDIGGFAGELPDKQLYLRASAMGCFCPVMQWHAEPRSGQFYATHPDGYVNDRSPWNLAEKLGDPQILDIARGFAKLRYALMPYILREAAACAALPRPMMAHLCFDFPDQPQAWCTHDQYMFGRQMLVAPVIEPGAAGRSLWLPPGNWRDYFTGQRHSGGARIDVACPLDRIPVFVKE